ncbi:serine/threonine-protein kinase [Nonomuraea longicatena]|uniref:non-specific serine/threonine protein kinase n=1 Tax=Nonomuraea longicatena TaxID=83682 RepID=A0ABN1PRD6_9ACTN
MSGGRLAHRYALLRPLGSGGMGRVWLARDELLDREVAVKELTLADHLGPAERAEAVTRAVREAQATAQLRHPGIVALHDVVVEYGRPWLVMELLRGRTLAQVAAEDGPMDQRRASAIGADVLAALMVAHAQGLQHRDVKPGNVFLTDSGRVVLTDFGIARQEGQATLTQRGLTIGSPGFIAPERLEGSPGGPASDLWSLGATVYHAVLGRALYSGSAAERIKATLTTAPPPIQGPLGAVLPAMLARDPAGRPHPAAVLDALQRVAAGQPAGLRPAGDDTAPVRGRRRGRALGLAAGSTAVLVAAGASAFLLLGGEDAAPSSFGTPIDVCTLLTSENVSSLLNTGKTPKALRSTDEIGPTCSWTLQGTGIDVQVQKDSDTANPWAMTPTTARNLLLGQHRQWNELEQVGWTWPEIGAKTELTARRGPIRKTSGLGEEGFAFELGGKDGRIHSAVVLFRVANLVVQVEYSTLANRPTDAQIRDTAAKAAGLVAEGLRRAG